MSEWLEGFNFSEVDAENGEKINEPLKAGWYIGQATEGEFKVNSKGTGRYLKLKFEITEGVGQGRFIFSILNLQNPNKVAVDIAKAELNTILSAMGMRGFNGSSEEECINELLNKPMKLQVKYVPEQDGYDAKNEIKNYKPMSHEVELVSDSSGSSSAPSSPSAPSQPSAPSTPSEESVKEVSDSDSFDDEAPSL
jgi:hypothetical protein